MTITAIFMQSKRFWSLTSFVQFHCLSLLLSMISKVFRKILVLFGVLRILNILEMVMVKDKKVNIAVT
jgi:hypothetical protein